VPSTEALKLSALSKSFSGALSTSAIVARAVCGELFIT
jgi:hypothetical protein